MRSFFLFLLCFLFSLLYFGLSLGVRSETKEHLTAFSQRLLRQLGIRVRCELLTDKVVDSLSFLTGVHLDAFTGIGEKLNDRHGLLLVSVEPLLETL